MIKQNISPDRFTVSAWLFHFAYASAVAYGVDADSLAGTFDFSLEELKDPYNQIPFNKHLQLFDDAVRISGNEFLWLNSFDVSRIARNNPTWYYAFNAKTFGDAVNRGSKYFKLLSNCFFLDGDIQGDDFVSQLSSPFPKAQFSDYQNDFNLSQWEKIWIHFAGPALELKRIRTPVTDPERLKKYEAFFQTPVEGGMASNDLVYDKSAKNLPNAAGSVDSNLDFFLKRLLEEAMESQMATTPFEKKLMGLFQAELQNGTPTLEQIAPQMGMGPRTLQRRLEGLGYTYTEALQHHRMQLAATYLKQPQINVTDVALMVGYSSLTSFSTAFLKYHGSTPSKFRQKFL